jgi:hypothetical protein
MGRRVIAVGAGVVVLLLATAGTAVARPVAAPLRSVMGHTATTLPHWGSPMPTSVHGQGPDPERPGPPGGARPHAIGGHDPATSATSANWAGEIATGTTYTEVSATWTVPSVVASTSGEATSTWIGIDGADNNDLIQAGTTEQVVGGSATYFAWYEILPAVSVPVGTVDPGDQMSVQIEEVAPGTWRIDITDATLDQSASGDVAYSGPGDSVEWIQEDPAIDTQGDLAPLADFGSVSFSGCGFAGADPSASQAATVDMAAADGTVESYVSAVGPGTLTITYGSPPPTSPPATGPTGGYDLVGDDGGVFVFGGGFFGSLPGLGIHVSDIVGIVPSSDRRGYFLVGADGGVFSFGDTTYEGSLPGLGVRVDDIAGIVPTADDRGYFLVGRDGGVFAFGDAPFENSLPGLGVSVRDVAGIAATADDAGYWVVGADGSVYAFGDAPFLGTAGPGSVAIAATGDGGGYWVVSAAGAVDGFGDAPFVGDVPDVAVVDDIVGIVPSSDSQGYDLIGSDGGVFTFGDAVNLGSLPGLGVHVQNVVGAVPT